MRFFCYTLGDPNTPMTPPGPEELEVMGAFVGEAMAAGVMVATGGMAPTSEGVKVQYSAGGSFKVTDGPFAEAKELIGGWALIDVASKEEAISWTKRFLAIVNVDGAESRVRQTFGPEDFAPADAAPLG
jgi:hypothetical protein